MTKISKTDRTVMITGAGRGYGRGLLDEFARNNWIVFPTVRQEGLAEELRDLYPGRCYPIIMDVCDKNISDEIVNVLQVHTQHLDVLINNAGQVKKTRGIANASPEDLLSHFDTHCVAVLRCVKAALPYLKRAGNSHVINISSRWGSIGQTAAGHGWPDEGPIYAYKISKCAQNMLTVCLHRELAAEGIRVLAVHPGKIKTQSAAPDANMEIGEASKALYKWIQSRARNADCHLFDIINDCIIDW